MGQFKISKEICYKCAGQTDEQHNENTDGFLFTQDMQRCYKCGKMRTSSSFVLENLNGE